MSYILNTALRTNISKDEMVRDMRARGLFFYHQKDEPGLQLKERRTTAILLQPNDFMVVGKLKKKIREGAEWPLSEFDFPIIKVLSEIRQDRETVRLRNDPNAYPHMYIVLALYLYLADMATIYPNPDEDSFMQACRKAGFLDANDKTPLREKLIKALDILDLYQTRSMRNLVDEWENYGTFKVDGLANYAAPKVTDETRTNDGTGEIYTKVNTIGVYSTLARTLMRNSPEGEFSPVVLMNNCIAYAQYVKSKFQGLSVVARMEEVLRHATLSATNESYALKAAHDGHLLREGILENYANESREALTYNYDKIKESEFFDRIFSRLSDQVVSVYYLFEIEVGYSEEFCLRGLYPENDIPGFTHNSCEISRDSKGLNISRFKFAMFSSDSVDANLNPDKKDFKLMHTVSHEALHIVFGSNGILDLNYQNEYANLRLARKEILKNAPEIFRNLVNSQSPDIANLLDTVLSSTGFTFRQTIDINYYKGYLGEEKTEEMLCNLYGLTQVEFHNSQYANALNWNHPDLKPIQELSAQLQNTVAQTIDIRKQIIGTGQIQQQQYQQQQGRAGH